MLCFRVSGSVYGADTVCMLLTLHTPTRRRVLVYVGVCCRISVYVADSAHSNTKAGASSVVKD